MHLMLQQEQADDYVIATGSSFSLQEFVIEAFKCVGLNWQDHVVTDSSLLRPTDLAVSKSNPDKAARVLNWQAKYVMHDVVRMMVEAN
jgi:GDPmannose 4,6-dehydratase